jgi:hypothetical protein
VFNFFRKFRQSESTTGLLDAVSKRELRARLAQLLFDEYDSRGPARLLDPTLCVVVTANGVALADASVSNTSAPEPLAEVRVATLPSALSYQVIRTENIAIHRDVVKDLAHEAARAIAQQLNALTQGQ